MQAMQERTLVGWSIVVLVIVVLALVGLLAYARGDDSDDGRSPEPGEAVSALTEA
jgi:hypothetical protein